MTSADWFKLAWATILGVVLGVMILVAIHTRL
jgi:hypothetical protein